MLNQAFLPLNLLVISQYINQINNNSMFKKVHFFSIIILMLMSFGLKAENYQIGFESSNPDIPIDSILVTNTNTSESLKLMAGDNVNLVSTVSVNERFVYEGKLDVFPNPMQQQTKLMFDAKSEGKAIIGVYEVSGREVIKLQRNLNIGINSFELSGINEGLYFVCVQGVNYQYTAKIVSRSVSGASPNLMYVGNMGVKASTLHKSATASLDLGFTPGDEIKYVGYSSVCDVAEIVEATAESKTITFEFAGCLASVNTVDATAISYSQASTGGTITMYGDVTIDACGVKWGTTENSSEWNEANKTSDTISNNAFVSSIENLAANTNYYIQSYIEVAGKTISGDIKSFTTLESPINANIKSIDSVSYNFVTLTGEITLSDSSKIDSCGFVYGSENNPTIESGLGVILCDTVNGLINTTINDLELDSSYYIRAFIIDSNLRVYSTTSEIKTLAPKAPVLKTSAPDSVYQTTMKCYAEVTDNGGLTTSRGYLLSLDSVITLEKNTKKVIAGTGVGDFSMKIEDLTPDTVYLVRAYAFNTVDTIYGAIDTVRTMAYSVPMVQLLDSVEVYQKTFDAYGNVLSNGGKKITRYGFVISKDGTIPTYEDNYKREYAIGDYTGEYTEEFRSLTPETKYFIRAFAKNEMGYGYSDLDSITTLPIAAPVISLDSITNITALSMVCNVNIASDGGDRITKKGIVYSTSQTPDFVNNDGLVTSSSTSSKIQIELSGLSASTKYFVRSFAINSIDTAYSLLDSVTTLTPTVAKVEVELLSFASDAATFKYVVVNNGGAAITAKGIVWSKTVNPTIEANDGLAADTNNNTEFDIVMNGLTENTVYYARAYATNSQGTYYTDSIMFNSGYAIGKEYEGGKVAYIFQPGDNGYKAGECHGIMVTKADYMDKHIWGEKFLVPAAESGEIGKGWENTKAIVDNNNGTYAAKICVNINTGGHTDWFLPTLNEMKMFDKNKEAIGGFKDTDYVNNMYWTSTDKSRSEAYTYNFEHGFGMTTSKDVKYWFRPARYF